MKIFFSNPSNDEHFWLPYTWGRLRSYAENNYENDLSTIVWSEPYFSDKQNLDEMIRADSIDILALSCYMWNWDTNLEIAEKVKAINPDCIVVAGGPEVPYRKPDFFSLYPNIDVVIVNEGERTFSEMLHRINVDQPYDNIPGILTRKTKIYTDSLRLDLTSLISPYKIYQEYFKELIEKYAVTKGAFALWEGNRGCPYKCAFCDWGSLTNGKIRTFSIEDAIDEVAIISDLQVSLLFVTDANFGIYKHDLDFATAMAKQKESTGYPKSVAFNPPKNKKDIADKINRIFFEAEMINTSNVPFQHTDQEVLDIMLRPPVKTETLFKEIALSYELGVPLKGVVIQGSPGDTVEKWKTCLYKMMDYGFHEEIRVHEYMMLPNAPAMDDEYLEKYQIELTTKPYTNSGYKNARATYIRSCYSYTIEDTVEFHLISSLIMGLHNYNATKFIARALNNTYGVSYREFYENLFNMTKMKLIIEEVTERIKGYIYNEDIPRTFIYKGTEVPFDGFIYYRFMEERKHIYFQLYNLLKKYMNSNMAIDLIKVQELSSVWLTRKSKVELNYDWVSYFRRMLSSSPLSNETLLKPFKKVINISIDENEKVGTYKQYRVPNTETKMLQYLSEKSINFKDYATTYREFLYADI